MGARIQIQATNIHHEIIIGAMTAEHIAHIIFKGAIAHGAIFTAFSLWKRKWSVAQKLGVVELLAWVLVAWIARFYALGTPPFQGVRDSALALVLVGGLVLWALSRRDQKPYMAAFPILVFVLLLQANLTAGGTEPAFIRSGALGAVHALSGQVLFGLALGLGAGGFLGLLGQDIPLKKLFLWFYGASVAVLGGAVAFRLHAFGAAGPLDPVEAVHLTAFGALSALGFLAWRRHWTGRVAAFASMSAFLVLAIAFRFRFLLDAGTTYHR